MLHNVKQKLRQRDKASQDMWLNKELPISKWMDEYHIIFKNAPTPKSSLQSKHTQVVSEPFHKTDPIRRSILTWRRPALI